MKPAPPVTSALGDIVSLLPSCLAAQDRSQSGRFGSSAVSGHRFTQGLVYPDRLAGKHTGLNDEVQTANALCLTSGNLEVTITCVLAAELLSSDVVLDALGNQTRREILRHLRQEPMAVGAIAARFPISRPAVSKHLRLLEEAGLVEHTASGASNIFRLRSDGFQTARSYLEQFWLEALSNFQEAVRQHVEQETGEVKS